MPSTYIRKAIERTKLDLLESTRLDLLESTKLDLLKSTKLDLLKHINLDLLKHINLDLLAPCFFMFLLMMSSSVHVHRVRSGELYV